MTANDPVFEVLTRPFPAPKVFAFIRRVIARTFTMQAAGYAQARHNDLIAKVFAS